jgi:hypothetical protein
VPPPSAVLKEFRVFTYSLRLVSVAALAAGAVAVVPGGASAAPAPCAVGKWRLTKYTLKSSIEGVTAKGSGGQGTLLTVGKKSVTYDFSRAKKVTTKGVVEGYRYTLVETFRKKVTFKADLVGKKKTGSISLKTRSGKGGATISGVYGGDPVATVKIAKSYKAGKSNPFVPTFGAYTCTGKTLKLVLEADGPNSTITSVHHYRRV